MEQVQAQTEKAATKRQTANMYWIADIKNASIDTSQQYPSFNIRDKNIVRVNLIAVVTAKYVSENGSYVNLGIDDGTGMISVKAWNEDTIQLNKQEIGNVVLVIGKLGITSSKESYVRPEIVRQIEMSWLIARKKELELKYGEPKAAVAAAEEPVSVIEEEVVQNVSKFVVRAKILEILNQNPEGMDEQKIASLSGYNTSDAIKAITELVREGEVYYSRPGVVKGL